MSLDLFIFSSFLVISLILGIISSSKVRNISEYAIGNRDFSTPTMVATIVATWIGAGFFSYTLIETYRQGIYFMLPAILNPLILIFIGQFLIPRMGEFMGKISIAESMGSLFGIKVRFITVLFSCIWSICYLGVNFKVSSKLLESIFGASGTYATIFSAIIVITYSALGGIRAVTFTDIIQFFTFGCLVPIIVIIVWQALGESNNAILWNTLTTNPLFDYKVAFNFSNPKFYEVIGLGLFFLLPELEPPMIQRIYMSKSIKQAVTSFKIAGIICFLFQCVIFALAIFILSGNSNLNPDDLVGYIINHYTYTGFKGIMAIGIMAMIMSSADSMINSMSIIFAHDVCKPLGLFWAKNELLVARSTAVIVGLGAIFFALRVNSIFNLVLSFAGLYVPVVSIPFFFAILGFRSSERSVLNAMYGSIITILLLRLFFNKTAVEGIIPGITSSIIFLFGTHYLTNQKGGWVGIKDTKNFEAVTSTRRRFWCKLWQEIVQFNFIRFSKSHAPKQIETFFLFGMLAIVLTIVSMVLMPSSALVYNNILSMGYMTVLTLACYLLTCPIWPNTFKNSTFVSIFWIFSSLYIYIFVSSIFLVLSNGSQIQTAIFFLNITAILLVFRWRVALVMFLIGFGASIWFIANFINVDYHHLTNMKFYLAFCLLLFSSILVAFLRPAQERYDRNTLLLSVQSKELHHMSQQLLKHMIIRQEFINNVNHEIRTPIHHVRAYLSDLNENWNTSSNEEKRESIDALEKAYERIKSYMDNILDLSKLSNNSVKLKYEIVNFQKLVNEIIDQFTSLYLGDKDLQFYLKCNTEDLNVRCDKDKISQVLINLLKNAVEFTPKGMIEVVLSKENMGRFKGIKCSVIDQGIGIPEEELFDIFGPFIQSSRTKNMSGGKGLGLAICEHIIKLHKGDIYAQNNLEKGATVAFVIPI